MTKEQEAVDGCVSVGQAPWSYRNDRTIADANGTPLMRCYAGRNAAATGPLAAAAPDLLAAAQAEEAAEDARDDCEECEGEGQWEHCGACSERFGRVIELRRAAINLATQPGEEQ